MERLGLLTVNTDIVIAHYKENIYEWINKIQKDNIRNIYLYTKNSEYKPSKQTLSNPKIIHKHLPNIGRESHTYITYCIDNYYNLPDFVIFLQGFSADHGVTLNVLNHWLNLINENKIEYTTNFKINNPNKGFKNGHINYWKGKTQHSKFNLVDWCKHYINKPNVKNKIKVYFGAVFGVCKNKILSRQIEEYKNLLLEFQTINPEACHFIERLWYYWFNLDIKNENIQNQ